MIPEEKHAAVTKGLRETFRVTEFEDIQMMTKGNPTTRVFRIVVKGSPYLLKMIMRTDDPTRHFNCMRAASGAGIAPHVWYTSVEDRVLITDFVEAAQFPASEALVRIPRLLRTLHGLPPFAGVPDHLNTSCLFLLNEGAARDEYLRKFRASNVLPQDDMDELFACYARVAAAYPRDEAEMVSSHNDLFKPDNTLFDGTHVWLVDWEAAFRNDRYADLGVVANYLVANEAEERAFLEEYFGEPANEYQRARFFLMQQLTHIFYGMVYMFMGSTGQPVDQTEKATDFGEIRRRMWAGEMDLREKDVKWEYGRAHWNELRKNYRTARFNEALKVVSERCSRA